MSEAKKDDVKLESFLISNFINQCLGAIEEFEQKMKAISEKREKIKKGLIEAAPDDLEFFLDEGLIVDNLLKWGRYSFKIVPKKSGFKSLKDVIERFERLKLAWKGVIKIRIDTSSGYRAEIDLNAI